MAKKNKKRNSLKFKDVFGHIYWWLYDCLIGYVVWIHFFDIGWDNLSTIRKALLVLLSALLLLTLARWWLVLQKKVTSTLRGLSEPKKRTPAR